MDITSILDAISPVLVARNLFLVDIKMSKDNDITVTLESRNGSMSLDDCEAVNRKVTETFSQDEEDYSLTVTSAGLDGEFKVKEQFDKALGEKVEVWMKGGKKTIGVLDAADDESVTVDGLRHEKSEINKVKYHIEF